LNEHFADAFGAMVKQWYLKQDVTKANWLNGDSIMGTGVTAKCLRTFKEGKAYENDPLLGTDPQPKHMSGKYTGTDDNGGVHINSGIPNHAFYKVALEMGGNTTWQVTEREYFNRPVVVVHLFARSRFTVTGKLDFPR
jgi:Zn-dependent metalloprotease